MDVTPIVQVLEAMPDGPTINLNVELHPTLNGDLTLLSTGDLNAPFGRDFMEFGNLNAPFGQDFMDVEATHDESENVVVGGIQNK